MNSGTQKQHSIVRMFSVYLVLGLLIISGIAFFASYAVSINKSRDEFQVKVDEKFRDLKEILKRPMWNFNDREIQIIGSLYLKQEYVDALTIKNNDGVILFSGGDTIKHPLFSRESVINYRGVAVGSVYYSVSGNFLDEMQSTYIWSYFINIVSVILATFFIVGFFLRSVLKKSFRNFINCVDEFSRGNEMAFDKDNSYFEFAPLVRALRNMAHERSEADALRRNAVELKEKIVTASPVGIAVYDGTGQCITANESVATIVGASKEQLLQQNYHQIESWKKSDMYASALRSLEVQTIQHLEVQITTSFNKTVSVDCQFAPIVVGDEHYLLLMVSDITERKRIEQALLDSELWMKSVFNSLNEAVLVVSPERELINVNKAAQRIFGYSMEEIFKNSTELFHVDHQHFIEFGERINKAFSKGDVANFEFEAKRKNGEIFPTEHTVSLLKNAEEEQLGIVSVVRDISERKQSEKELLKHQDHLEDLIREGNQELYEREQQLKDAQRIAHLGNYKWDLNKNTFSWSDTVFELFGLEPGSVQPTPENFLAQIHPDDIKSISVKIKEALSKTYPLNKENRVSMPLLDYRIVRPDESVLWLRAEAVARLSSDGHPLSIHGTVQDVTPHKLAEQEIMKAKLEAERASTAKSDFLSCMSHELRTPMNAILGFGQLLELNSAGMNEIQQGQIKEILDAGTHLLTLINEVLDLARIESGKLDYYMEKVRVIDVLSESLSLIKPLAEARQIKLLNNIRDSNYNVHADVSRVKQIFLNLLSNAVKYNCENGTITIESKVVEDQRLRISISDTGEGLSEEDISNLYTPFERLNAKENVEGTGIGLTITKHLVELMDGTIEIESALGKGSTFSVELNLI